MLDNLVERLKSAKCSDRSELGITLKTAPLLKALKPSSMFFATTKELEYVCENMKKAGLDFVTLYEKSDRNLIFVYRSLALGEHLFTDETYSYLRSCDYKGNEFSDFLPRLRKRLKAYYEKKDIFPHEVGVFLGYPLCDIQGFIKYQGDAYLFSGYWKIYDNLNQTLLKFADFDRAKEEAVDEWFAGKKLYEIAC